MKLLLKRRAGTAVRLTKRELLKTPDRIYNLARYVFPYSGSNVWYTGFPAYMASHPLFEYITENPPEGYTFRKYKSNCQLALVPNWIRQMNMPWVLEMEDVADFFLPHGDTATRDISRERDKVRKQLEDPNLKMIIPHLLSTALSIPKLFGSKVGDKVFYIPLGIGAEVKSEKKSEVTTLLFTNSFHQSPPGFYLRGGLDVLEAYRILIKNYKNIRLVIKSALPEPVRKQYSDVLRHPSVTVIEEYLGQEEMQSLMTSADLFLLPSARIHSICQLEAMASGAVCISSDGWGNDEIVQDDVTGIIIKGRYGVTSWVDKEGMLREDYRTMYAPSPQIYKGLAEAVARLLDHPREMASMRQASLKNYLTYHSVNNWKVGLKMVFDRCLN